MTKLLVKLLRVWGSDRALPRTQNGVSLTWHEGGAHPQDQYYEVSGGEERPMTFSCANWGGACAEFVRRVG